jgi:hypothetical protein
VVEELLVTVRMAAALITAPTHHLNLDRRPPAAPAAVGTLMAARGEYHDPESRHHLGPMNVACPNCGALHWIDEQVGSPRLGCAAIAGRFSSTF